MDQTSLTRLVTDELARMPAWVRLDLSSKDERLRRRAEETLAAALTAALARSGAPVEESR